MSRLSIRSLITRPLAAKPLIIKKLAVIAVLSGVSFAANAVTILNNSSSGYYNSGIGTLLDTNSTTSPFPCANVGCGDLTLSFPTAPNLSAAAGVLGTWLTNAAPTGGAWSATPQAIPSTWTVNTETAISYAIDAGTGLSNVHLSLGVDNGIFVWLNGAYLFGARAAGGSSLGEYSLNLADLSGTNYLQIIREDHGGGTGFDISLTADITAVKVPEPASIATMGIGLLGLAFFGRKWKTRKTITRK